MASEETTAAMKWAELENHAIDMVTSLISDWLEGPNRMVSGRDIRTSVKPEVKKIVRTARLLGEQDQLRKDAAVAERARRATKAKIKNARRRNYSPL